jgi:hypothetical protein
MILPLYICTECGSFGGLGLSFSQHMSKASRGEKTDQDNSNAPDCPFGHGRMYEVKEGDRLTVLPVIQITPPSSA